MAAIQILVALLREPRLVEAALIQRAFVRAAVRPDTGLPIPLARQQPDEPTPIRGSDDGARAECRLVAKAVRDAALEMTTDYDMRS